MYGWLNKREKQHQFHLIHLLISMLKKESTEMKAYYLNICFALAPLGIPILKPEERFLAFSNN